MADILYLQYVSIKNGGDNVMKKLPRRMLVLTLSASLALTPAYAQASALPDTLQAEDATGQFTAVELSELKESLQQTL